LMLGIDERESGVCESSLLVWINFIVSMNISNFQSVIFFYIFSS
jgi:hypothetical protein